MARRDYEVAQDGGITFGDWKLVPCEGGNASNWELCHRHATTVGRTAGKVQWNRCGRFYQYNTFENALLYAADAETKEGRKDRALEITKALEDYRAIVGALKADMAEAIAALADKKGDIR